MTAVYETGTVSVTAGSAVVTGTGTGWITSGLVAGQFGLDSANGNPVPVLSIDSDTQITLVKPWRGTSAAAQAYWITYDTQPGQQSVSNAQMLADYIARLNNDAFAAISGLDPASDMMIVFTGPTTAILIPRASLISGADYDVQVDDLAARDAYDLQAEGFSVLVSDVGDGGAAIYSKRSSTAGDWTDPARVTGQQGAEGDPGPVGVVWRGNWNSGTTYAINDLTLDNGSSWISLQAANTNHAPPTLPTESNAWWQLVTRAGTNGTGTGDVVGPVSSTAGNFPRFADTSGKLMDEGVGFGTEADTIAQGNDARLNNNAKLNAEDQTLTGGARVTSKDLGTITTGTLTPDPGDRPLQHYVNNGAHTLSPGSNGGSYMLDITNGASAGAITLSGWTKTAGDAFTLTNGHKFRLHCSVGNGGSLLIVQALQ